MIFTWSFLFFYDIPGTGKYGFSRGSQSWRIASVNNALKEYNDMIEPINKHNITILSH